MIDTSGNYLVGSKSLQEDLARTGARLGIVEPLLRRCLMQELPLREVWQSLREAKQYELADKLRGCIQQIEGARLYLGIRSPLDPKTGKPAADPANRPADGQVIPPHG